MSVRVLVLVFALIGAMMFVPMPDEVVARLAWITAICAIFSAVLLVGLQQWADGEL